MQKITLQFDRVFDIVRVSASKNNEAHTWFSFDSGDQHQYGVRVSGRPRIETGDTITAILKKDGDWQTLLGWTNHNTKEIAAPEASRRLIHAITSGCISSVWAFFTLDGSTIPFTTGAAVRISVLLLFVLLTIMGVLSWHEAKSLRRVLADLSRNSTPTLDGVAESVP